MMAAAAAAAAQGMSGTLPVSKERPSPVNAAAHAGGMSASARAKKLPNIITICWPIISMPPRPRVGTIVTHAGKTTANAF